MAQWAIAWVLLAPQAAALPWQGLPAPAAGHARVEAAVWVADARATLQGLQALVGAAAPAAAWDHAQRALFRELAAGLEIATPGPGALPATVAWLSHGGEGGVVVTLAAAPGLAQRLGGPLPEGWSLRRDDGQLTLQAPSCRWAARVDSGGWLQIATQPALLSAVGGSEAWLPADVQAALQGFDLAWAWDLTGAVGARLRGQPAASAGHAALAAAEVLAGAWRDDGLGSRQLRALARAPEVASLAAGLGPRQAAACRVPREALSVASAVLPAGWRGVLGAAAGAGTGEKRELWPLLAALDGRLTWANMGAPGDVALVAQTASPGAARELGQQLGGWLARALAGTGMAPPAVEVRGADVILAASAARARALPAKGRGSLAAGPLTAPMRAALEAPAHALAYAVLGGETTWLSAVLGRALGPSVQGQLIAQMAQLHPELPARMAGLLRRAAARAYDTAVVVDLEGALMRVDLLASDLEAPAAAGG